MSTDIRLYAEIRRDGRWAPIPEPQTTSWSKGKLVPVEVTEISRPYQLFAALAGVCQDNLRRTKYAVVEPIAEPRGFPEDLNEFYKEYFATCVGCHFGHSWLKLQEIINYDWDGQYVKQRAYVKTQYAPLFPGDRGFPADMPVGESIYFILPNGKQEPGTTEVSWVTSYRDYVEHSEAFIEELLELGEPNEIRIVFWFEG
jgi:hypothetical protein